MRDQTISPELLGAIAGAVTCIIFLIYHQLTISNIWFSAVFMIPISALAGFLLAKSYIALFDNYSHFSWIGFVLYFIVALTGLSLVSVLIFEPEMVSGELLNLSGPVPESMIAGTFPLTLVWMVLVPLVFVYGKTRSFDHLPLMLGTSASLFLTLGLNLSVLGKVEVEPQHQYLMEKFLAMNAGLGLVFLALYSILYSLLSSSGNSV